tara:strand:- start:1077 stop:1832 length:756 start_codon:yes stop_codon:yes gene_type:complete
MELRPRVIPSLLLQEGQLVKGSNFNHHMYLGDPLNAVKIFNDMQVDELSISEISKNNIDFLLLEKISSRAFMPLSYGGNIKTIQDARKLFNMGFERLVLNSLFYKNPNAIEEIVETFGSSSVSVSIDYKYSIFKKLFVCSESGKKKENRSIEELVRIAEKLNIGEIIFQCIDREGTRKSADKSLLKMFRDKLDLQITIAGGVSSFDEIRDLSKLGADGILVGDLFTFSGRLKGLLLSYPESKQLDSLYVSH